jgi:hypothetical protein
MSVPDGIPSMRTLTRFVAAVDADQVALAERMRASGEPMPVIAQTLGVSRATLYRTLAERPNE